MFYFAALCLSLSLAVIHTPTAPPPLPPDLYGFARISQDISPSLMKGLRDSGRADVLPKLYHAVLPTLVAVDDVEGLRLKPQALDDVDGFGYLKKPVGQSSGAMLSYNGPIRGVGSIVEVWHW